MSVVKTTEEFSTRRKVRYGVPSDNSTLSASRANNASFSPHKYFYAKDQDGNDAYFIEFNIGDFNFDEITIRTEGKRLIVKGKSESKDPAKEEFSREFTRDFTLPSNVDPYSIKAQLDEATRQLSLIGQLTYEPKSTASSITSSTVDRNAKIGSIREIQSGNRSIDYEIYLGNEFKDGKSTIELSGYNALTIRVVKSDWDKYGDVNLELKRQIKLPPNANAQNIEQGIDSYLAILIVKVPLK